MPVAESKRYQVFISSTFEDLENARREVSEALLRAECFPAGMELFPAADEEQFEFIKSIIDQSDYYILISAGRYGSLHPVTGISYTEMEYDYAIETSKPVIRLLHKDPFNELAGALIENSDDGRAKLRAFREKLSSTRLVRFWSTPSELGVEVLVSLNEFKRRYPATGWTQAIDILEEETREQFAEMSDKIRKLLQQNASLQRQFRAYRESVEREEEILGNRLNSPLSKEAKILFLDIFAWINLRLDVRREISVPQFFDYLSDELNFDDEGADCIFQSLVEFGALEIVEFENRAKVKLLTMQQKTDMIGSMFSALLEKSKEK